MLDPKLLRSEPEVVREALKKRNADAAPVDKFLAVDADWRKLTAQLDELKAKQNAASAEIAKLKKEKKDAAAILGQMKKISEEAKQMEKEQADFLLKLNEIVLTMPNVPHSSVPAGKSAADNPVIREWGSKPQFSFKPLPHDEIGKKLDILDFDRAAKLSGSRFVVYKGLGAALERALISFMLDLHTKEHGYTEVMTPVLVKPDALRGTGQLPKFEEELFKC
ncbi:MAG TPA: hypothetical protein VMT55_02380, partial [Candidatus Sulfotelmatobacter sp.]|nr:hypothetical protein [Candidatus Sulfotelmatobacter sp.]